MSVDLASEADRIRRPFLEALPLPAAILDLSAQGLLTVDHNTPFDLIKRGNLFVRCGLIERLTGFLAGDKPVIDFDCDDGDQISGRSYSVRAARLPLIEGFGRRCLLTLLDRTAERSTAKSLKLEMFNDSLTGLPNRAGFSDALEGAIEAGEPGRLAVLIIDLTRFSRINESVGALAGDELLITVARRLLSTMRAGDVLARTGGNEFGVFVAIKEGVNEALVVAQRVSAALTDPCRLSDLEIKVGCAVGCAVSEEGCDADELIRRAQFALKRAKITGDTEIYQPRAFDIACHQFTVETSLRRAIEGDRLRLAFQPVIELATGRVAGFEALARWCDNGTEVPPSTFVPVAEESGLIIPLGRWAVDAAVRTLADWDRAAGGQVSTSVAVNVSAIQIARDDVPQLVAKALADHHIASRRLTVELTESAIIADPDRATAALAEIREIGATLALDDFGTGYSNLAYLRKLPLDVLKIDQSFVTGMLADKDKVAIVRAILSLAQALGLKTTAEGVESIELAQSLTALGCTRGQGYFYAAPLAPDAAFEFWSRNNAAT